MPLPDTPSPTLTVDDLEIFVVWRRIELAMDLPLWESLGDDERVRFSKITHEGRKREWCEGRRALSALPEDCRLTSVAHSNDCVVAIGTRAAAVQGIGVDLEPHDREISQRVTDWLGHDGRLMASVLETWTVKEACFKADRGKNEEKVLADYVINSRSTATIGAGTTEGPARHFSFALRREGDWLLALAVRY